MSFLPERLPVCVLVAALAAVLTPSQAADAGGRAAYVGGTLAHLPPKAGGRILTADQRTFLFETERTRVQVPYDSINLLEYGQQAGRRYIMAIVISPVFLLTKARKHFLTVAYRDEEGRQQAMVFQLHKSDVRAVLAGLEARTGLKVEFQDGEARKAGGG
jgi:V8-like Glu-specific endopeptidase